MNPGEFGVKGAILDLNAPAQACMSPRPDTDAGIRIWHSRKGYPPSNFKDSSGGASVSKCLVTCFDKPRSGA
jgi:hypothetical protein